MSLIRRVFSNIRSKGAQRHEAEDVARGAQAKYERRLPERGAYQLPASLNEPMKLIGPDGNPVSTFDESGPAVILSTGTSNTSLKPPPNVANIEYFMPDQILNMEPPAFVVGWATIDQTARAKRPGSRGWFRAIARGTVKIDIQGQTFALMAWGVRGAVSDAVRQYHVDASILPDWIVAHLDEKYDFEAAHEAWMAESDQEEPESQEGSMEWPDTAMPYQSVDSWSQDQFASKMDAVIELETRGDLLGALSRYEQLVEYAHVNNRLPSAMLALNRAGLVHLDLGNYYEAIEQFRVSMEYGESVEEIFEFALEDDTEFGDEVRASASERVRYLRTLQAMALVGSAKANLAVGNSDAGYRLAERGGDLAEQAGDEEWQKEAYRLMAGSMLLGPDFRG